ncbi:MAG: hypothetical protein Q8M07_26915, partial [Prosthecobacter sp.]|nr:hypothetical protein [Prosthecobacter sp.]
MKHRKLCSAAKAPKAIRKAAEKGIPFQTSASLQPRAVYIRAVLFVWQHKLRNSRRGNPCHVRVTMHQDGSMLRSSRSDQGIHVRQAFSRSLAQLISTGSNGVIDWYALAQQGAVNIDSTASLICIRAELMQPDA